MKMHISKNNPVLNRYFKPLLTFCEWMGTHLPKTYMRVRYFLRFHSFLHLKHPKTLNEKILYCSLCTDTTEWTRLADKYRVREYIHERGLDDILVPLYGVWEKAEDCDFSQLPNQFVLKCNHGCGDVLVVKDKNKLDEVAVKSKFQQHLDKPFGAAEAGLHYLRIKPLLIAEQLLVNDELSATYTPDSLIDYKIWCFNGKAAYIMTLGNRTKDGLEIMIYDTHWNAHPEYCQYDKFHKEQQLLPKPIHLNRMIEIAQTLAGTFPVVSVDLYNLNGKIFFGELTFTRGGGLLIFYSQTFQNMAGDMINLETITQR